MKQKINTSLITSCLFLFGFGGNFVSAQPSTNPKGDYQIKYEQWEVVDPDPQGLNCRALPAVVENPSDAVWSSGLDDISKWVVVERFRKGKRLTAAIGRLGDQRVIIDNQGNPWLYVNRRNSQKGCVVRANNRFIKPVAVLSPEGTKLE
jgi:hypothetical protein